MSDLPQQAASSRGSSLVTLAVVVVLGFGFVGVGVFLERHGLVPIGSASTPSEGGGDTARRTPLDVLRPEQVLIDETVAVAADGHYSKEFELPTDRPVRIIAEGVQGTANGFSIHCVEPRELGKLKAREQFRYLPDLGARKIQKFDHTSRLPAGRYVVVITNTENWFFTMQVRVRVIVNPK